jgi:hypothetical protein
MAVIFILTTLVSCEKEVHIDLGESAAKMVVQGQIETNTPPFVVLTSTISFFSTVDLSTLQNFFIHDAVVKVSDGLKTVKLREYAFDTGSNNKFYFYGLDTANLSNLMFGEVGKYYTLTIEHGGVTYTSTTKIPPVKGPDSVWLGSPIFKRSGTPDSAIQLYCSYTDPDTPGNYVRYFTQRNSEQFLPSELFDDQVVNGKVINNIALFAGYRKEADVDFDSVVYFYPGDTVTLKWAEVDNGVYTFWNTFQFATQSTGNPFASPINVKSNISNGGLGIWAGYSNWLKTIVIPR